MVKGKLKIRVPNPHKSGDITDSLLHEILRQAGISNDEWNKAWSIIENLKFDINNLIVISNWDLWKSRWITDFMIRQELSSPIVFSCFDDNLQKASEREDLDQG